MKKKEIFFHWSDYGNNHHGKPFISKFYQGAIMNKKRIFITFILLLFYIQLSAQIKNLDDLKKKYPEMTVFTEQSINLLGYRLIQTGKITRAAEVLALNARLFPKSWNVYDSLAEVFSKAGKQQLAIETYRKSLQLNPKNINGKRMLQKLIHPMLAPFTGNFEYYKNHRYHGLTIYIKDGTLMFDEPRHPHLAMKPEKGETGTFTTTKDNKPCRFVFRMDTNTPPNQFKWIQAESTIEVIRRPGTILKERYTREELAADFKQFRDLVETIPGHTYKFISREEFDRLFTRQQQAIDRALSLLEFYTLMVPLKAKIGCGHCHLDYPGEYRAIVQSYKFPLILTFLDNRCYVTENLQPKAVIEPFSEITAINGLKIAQIIAALKTDISADGYNDHFKTAALADCFQYYYANHYGAPKTFELEFKSPTPSGKRMIMVPALPCRGINYSNKKPSKLDFKILPQQSTAIMTVDSFIYYGKKNKIFFDYVDKAFEEIKQKKINNLIIDLRGNGGGDPFCASHLLSYIERNPVPYFSQPYGKYARLAKPIPMAKNHFSGKLYMLTNGGNFSTTLTNKPNSIRIL